MAKYCEVCHKGVVSGNQRFPLQQEDQKKMGS